MLEYCTKHTMLEYIGLKLLGNLILVCHLKKQNYMQLKIAEQRLM